MTRFVGRKLLHSATGKDWTVKEVKRRLAGRNIAIFNEEGAPGATELEAFCVSDAR